MRPPPRPLEDHGEGGDDTIYPSENLIGVQFDLTPG